MIVDFTSENMEASKKCYAILQVLKEKNHKPLTLCLAQLSFKNE